MATEVILKDEATCRAVEYALWYHASCTVEGTLDEECWKAADEVAGINEIDDGAMPSSELADARLNTLVIARADPLVHVLEGLIRLLEERLREAAQYGPLPMGDVIDIAAELRWAAEEAIRMLPQLATRLTPRERKAVA